MLNIWKLVSRRSMQILKYTIYFNSHPNQIIILFYDYSKEVKKTFEIANESQKEFQKEPQNEFKSKIQHLLIQ